MTTKSLNLSLNKGSRATNKVQFINFTNKLYQDAPITINDLIISIDKRTSENKANAVQLNVKGAKPLKGTRGKFIYTLPIVILPNRTIDLEFITTTATDAEDQISEVFDVSVPR